MKRSKADLADATALSIRQPWAELILRRRKLIEIRTWTRKYRGLLLIPLRVAGTRQQRRNSALARRVSLGELSWALQGCTT